MFELTPSAFYTLPDGRRLRYAINEPSGTARHTMVIGPGRREFIEKKQYELGAHLTQRGFRQIYFEWYGQGLSDRPLTGSERQRDHAPDFNVHLNDFRAFHRDIVTPNSTGKTAVTGHSMGAHLLLRWLTEDRPQDIKAAFMTAPMMAIGNPVIGSRAFMWVAQHLSAKHIKKGEAGHYASAQADYMDDPLARRFDHNVLSSDPENFALMERYFAAHPDLTVGGVTWQWMAHALASIYTSRKPGYLANITTPVLNIAGSKDMVTPPGDTMPILITIPNSEHCVIAGSRHDVLNEAAPLRAEAWAQIDPFLFRKLG